MTTQSAQLAHPLRTVLEERYALLSRRVSKIGKNLRQANGPLSADFQEQAVELENDEVLHALDDAGRAELAQIQKALQDMENDCYGYCKGCDEAISEARLQALPFTQTCISCAEALEAQARKQQY